MASDRSVPPVVAVVVTCQPGPWLEETLRAVGGQDYPNLSVLVVDGDSGGGDDARRADLAERVAAVLPDAYLRRRDEPGGFAAGANEVIGAVDGASYFLLCHDDAAPAPDAVRLLVEEAFRANAGIVAPKLADWQDPDRLLAVGATIDRVGTIQPVVERGELDQGQHDTARDVFLAPGGATLVRSDLFEALGGYDPGLPAGGEDLDLCWRAWIAGARVRVAPAARVRHLEAHGCRLPDTPEGRLAEDRWRWRTLLTCASSATLVWLLPLALLYAAGEALTELVTGHAGRAWEVAVAPGRAWRRAGALRRARRRAQQRRAVHDHRLRALQARGNGRFRAWLAGLGDGAAPGPVDDPVGGGWPAVAGGAADLDGPTGAGPGPGRPQVRARLVRDAVTGAGDGPTPGGAAAGGAPTVATRAATSGSGPPATASNGAGPAATAADAPGSPALVAADAAPDPHPAGGAVAPDGPEPATGPRRLGGWGPVTVSVLALVVVLLVGSRGLLVHRLPAVGSIPVTNGGIAHWWQAWSSSWQPAGLGRPGPGAPALGLLSLAGVLLLGATGVLQHLLVLGPLLLGPIGAYRLARPWGSPWGRGAALIAYAACPLAYDALAWGRWEALTVYAAAPWSVAALARLSDALPHPRRTLRQLAGSVLALGLLTALTAAVAPSWLLVVPVAAAALGLGSLLAGQAAVTIRLVAAGIVAAVLAGVLLLPWSAGVVGHGQALLGAGPGPAGAPSFARLLRFQVGPVGAAPLEWGLLVAGALPLAIGRAWRLAWAIRLWVLALASFGWAYLGAAGVLPSPPVDILLVPAAVGLAGAVALGVVAFEQDLPGYRFGWRQGASALAAVGLVVSVLPVLGDAAGGHWQLPTAGPASALSSLDGAPGGDYRILWVGDPRAIPMAAAPLGGGQVWATSFDGLPTVTDTWAGGPVGGGAVIATDLRLAGDGRTTQLGHLLAPLGVRYLVVPRADAPSGSGAASVPVPGGLLRSLRVQTDLEAVGSDPNYRVYLNAAWLPARAAVAGGIPLPTRMSLRALAVGSLGPARAALSGPTPWSATGPVVGGERIYVASSYDPGWRLVVDHRALRPARALGVGMTWTVPAGLSGRAVLRPGGSPLWAATRWLVVALWLLVIGLALAARRGGGAAGGGGGVRAEWFQPPAPVRRPAPRRADRRPVPVGGGGDDELWADG